MRGLSPVFLALVAYAVFLTNSLAQQSQIDWARQIGGNGTSALPSYADVASASVIRSEGQDTDSFGLQQILREKETAAMFRAFAEVSLFATDNVGLSRASSEADSFLLPVFGLEFRRPLRQGLHFEATVRFAAFRYEKFSELDFNSLDAGMGLSYQWQKLGGIAIYARYNFNELISQSSGEPFFKNHTFTGGFQKTFAVREIHSVFFGASGVLGVADQQESERSEISIYAGAHYQLLPQLDFDLTYRMSGFFYSVGGRRDFYQTISAGLRYKLHENISLSFSPYYTWNRSNLDVFGYEAGTVGGGLLLNIQF